MKSNFEMQRDILDWILEQKKDINEKTGKILQNLKFS